VDVAGASLALVLLSPLMLGAALAVKVSSPGPVFYSSWRVGKGGQKFRFHKFRTMCVDAEKQKKDLLAQNEASGPVFKMERDPRITPIGRILRKSSVDELPQLWNVLVGDMALVGPRPPIPEETIWYEPWQRRRLELKGGLTCLWQISGRSNVSFEEWCRLDVKYHENRSFLGDVGILFRTVPAVFTARGAK
jgi:lipopolysaccharide/colanic/teichoic acid biosynthesis glycosyltransferase